MTQFTGRVRVTSGENSSSTNKITSQSGTRDAGTAADALSLSGTANASSSIEMTLTNASCAQSTTITIPDPGASSASVLLSSGTNTSGTFTSLTATTGTITKLVEGGLIQPASVTITPAAGATDECLVTCQVKDGAGTNMTRPVVLDVWLSDASTGLGVTATTASGAVVAGATGTDLVDLTAKKYKKVVTNASGSYTLSITDTAHTGFYVAVNLFDNAKLTASAQLTAGNYGA